jgi:hypothetical protein
MARRDTEVDRAAVEALTRHLDEHFGNCYLPSYIAEALAAGIAALRAADPKNLEEDVAEFLESAVPSLGDTRKLARESASLDDADETAERLSETIEMGEVDGAISDVLGGYAAIGGWSSLGFAVMTADTMETCVITRNGRFATFDRSSVDGWDNYCLTASQDLASDPDFHDLRLEIASNCFGLGPGVSIVGEDELDDELREMTLTSDEWATWWHDYFLGDEDLDDLVGEYVEEFESRTGLPADEARTRLAELIQAGESQLEPERVTLWNIWKDARLRW